MDEQMLYIVNVLMGMAILHLSTCSSNYNQCIGTLILYIGSYIVEPLLFHPNIAPWPETISKACTPCIKCPKTHLLRLYTNYSLAKSVHIVHIGSS